MVLQNLIKKIIDYKLQYPNYKFILQAQLERVLEKYNLYQRECSCYMGDIPEKNIKDIENFKIKIKHLPENIRVILNMVKENPNRFLGDRNTINREIYDFIAHTTHHNFSNEAYLPIDFIISIVKNIKNRNSLLSICAIEPMFNEDAWKEGKQRIIGKKEIEAKSQVDLDPIVLFEVDGGYLIVTAWGDESNDELVFNEKQN